MSHKKGPVYLSLKITEEGELPLDNKGNIKKMPKNAVAYAIPGKAEVILSDGKKTLFKENLPIAQNDVVCNFFNGDIIEMFDDCLGLRCPHEQCRESSLLFIELLYDKFERFSVGR